MADLWKDGDVITAEKLNRIVFANVTATDGNILQLDITPNDVFDENDTSTSLVVVRYPNGTACMYSIAGVFAFFEDKYVISINMDGANESFIASSRTDYFTNDTSGGGDDGTK